MSDHIYPGLSSPHLKEIFAERELQIMEAALEVFAEKGFQASSTREIAARAGIAEGTIFRYFKTKKEILTRLAFALFEKYLVPLVIGTVEEILSPDNAQPVEAVIEQLLRERLALARANLRYIQLLVFEMQFHQEFRQNFFNEIVWKLSSIAVTYLEKKQQDGIIRPDVNPRAIVFALVGMTASFILWDEFFHGNEKVSFSDEEIVTQVTKILLHGIKQK